MISITKIFCYNLLHPLLFHAFLFIFFASSLLQITHLNTISLSVQAIQYFTGSYIDQLQVTDICLYVVVSLIHNVVSSM